MRSSVSRPLKIAAFSLLAVVGIVLADVKLRIYLKDGSLQSGNLVSETDKSFVILSKAGREEIPKDKIMFINGKTLAQWQARPDKFFQTEIIPSEIPNPGYVNDKVALPQVPSVSNVAVPAQKAAAPVKSIGPRANNDAAVRALAREIPKPTPTPAAPKPTPSISPVSTQAVAKPTPTRAPVVESPKGVSLENKSATVPVRPIHETKRAAEHPPLVFAPPAQGIVPLPHARKHHRHAPVEVKEIPAPVVAMAHLEPAPPKGSREDLASFHFDRGQKFLAQAQHGRAIQEFQLSAVLNRQNPDAAFQLAKLYVDDGLYSRASKLLTHPVLKKRDDSVALAKTIEKKRTQEQRQRWALKASPFVGTLLALLMIPLKRRLSRPAPSVVISAENLPVMEEPAMASPEIAEQPSTNFGALNDVLLKAQEIQRAKQARDKEVKEPVEQQRPMEKAVNDRLDIPVKEKPVFTVIPAEPPQTILPPEPSPVLFEPSRQPEPVVNSEPAVVFATEELLKVRKAADELTMKGHSAAAEGNLEKARREYRTALALDPNNLPAMLGVAYACFMSSQWDLALAHYLKALALDPLSADAHYGVGRVYLETERVDDAVVELQKALQIDPTYFEARDTLTELGRGA